MKNGARARAMSALAAVAALGSLLLTTDGAGAKGGAASVAPAASHGGAAGGRSGGASAVRGGRAVRHGTVTRPGLRARTGLRHKTGGVIAAPVFYQYGDDVEPGCQVRRLQISDDYGWRVRQVVVCPPRDGAGDFESE